MNTLINGMGTVGSRVAHLLLSMQVPIHGVKFSASKDDIKTQEILSLYQRFGAFPMIAAQGNDYDQRVQQFKAMGLHVEEKDSAQFPIVIDGTDGDITAKNVEVYKKNGQRFLVQGGSDFELAQKDFVSAPNSVGQTGEFPKARQVSCNTTFCSTALGLVLEEINDQSIASVDVELHRRCRDPGEKKEMRESLELKSSHHAEDIMSVLPQIQGKVTSKANINAWEHFHHTQLTVNFTKKVSAEKIAEHFKAYPRCIWVEPELTQNPHIGMKIIMGVSSAMNVPDADTLLPIYSVHQLSDTSIMVRGFTPQRSVIALSCVDWLWMTANKIKRWKNAFDYTNKNAKWHGYSIADLKRTYEEKVRVKVAAV